MINQAKYKICRRLGPGVFEKCQSQKFMVSEARRSKSASKKRPKAMSDYGMQLIEKQRIRFSYGVSEKQFSNYVKGAVAQKGINTATKLFESLETRLDNVVYRSGLAVTRALARQMVSHGHLVVNGKKLTIPSYEVKVGDKIEIREGSKNKALFSDLDKKLKNYSLPEWIKFDVAKGLAEVIAKPKNTDTFLNYNAVIEFYSR